MRLPDAIAASRTIGELSSNVDLLPILAGLYGIDQPQGIQVLS